MPLITDDFKQTVIDILLDEDKRFGPRPDRQSHTDMGWNHGVDNRRPLTPGALEKKRPGAAHHEYMSEYEAGQKYRLKMKAANPQDDWNAYGHRKD
jgi:hypothetical protein